jgi:hypothetical protein
MPEQLSDAEFDELVWGEKDSFKLAIRGHLAVEGEIDAALNDAFSGGLPRELARLPFALA